MGLTSNQVKKISDPGRYPDGDGLFLHVRKSGRKNWIYRFQLHGKRRDMGLGVFPAVGLAEARQKHLDARRKIADGIDPVASKKARSIPTFKQAATEYIDIKSHEWTNAKHTQQWTNTLTTYAFPVLGNKKVDQIETTDILEVLRPIWNEKRETATRVRSRIENVLGYCAAHGHRDSVNPARWRMHLDKLLPAKPIKPVHHAALDYTDMPEFMRLLAKREAMAARAMEFTILTACRTGDTLGATWDEIDLKKKLWIIPAPRTKTKQADHRVPLSPPAIKLLKDLPRVDQYVFTHGAKPMSNMAMLTLLRRMEVKCTIHGFRSTFRDWTAEQTSTPNHVAEQALQHTIASAVEAAYRRGDLFDKRKMLMNEWAEFLYGA